MARWISIFPLHGSGRFVVLTDVSQELFVQIRNGSEYASGDDVALDLAEPQLNLIQPRRVGRSEVQVNLGMHRQEVHVHHFAPGITSPTASTDPAYPAPAAPRGRLARHLPAFGFEGGVKWPGS